MCRVALLLLICLLLMVSACDARRQAFVPVDLPEEYEIPDYLPWERPEGGKEGRLYVTGEQALFDFDYMWAMLLQNATFLRMVDDHAGLLGFTFADVQKNSLAVRDEIARKDLIDLYDFWRLLRGSFGRLSGYGHLNLLTPDFVAYMREALDYGQKTVEESRLLYSNMLEVLDAPKVKEAYACLAQNFKVSGGGYDVTGRTDLGITLTYRGGVPVIRIPTAMYQGEQAERAVLRLNALMESCLEAEHLIIDLRGNGGGNSEVLTRGVLEYLVKEPVKMDFVWVSGCGSLTRFLRGWDSVTLENAEKNPPENDSIGKLRKQFPAVFTKTDGLTPGEKCFSGKAWVLVDGGVASAAEDFVILCKKAKLATLVGKRTKGGGMSSQPVVFSLPNSGLVVFFEDVAYIDDDGACNTLAGTEPDVIASGDALEYCLTLIGQDGADE